MKILGYFLQVRHNCGLTSFGKCDIIAMFISGYGGIGRRVGFRFRWATVQVQLLLPVPNEKHLRPQVLFVLPVMYGRRSFGGGSSG